jgi:modification target Cys-rich repeat protein
MRRVTASLVGSALLTLLALAGCPGGAKAPGLPGGVPGGGGGKASSVDPDTCGNYAASEAGAKLKAFLEATVTLNEAVIEMEGEIKASCSGMAEKLGVSTDGDTKAVCNAVSEAIEANLKAGIKGKASLKVDYKPAVCTVNADVAVDAAAKCEASASADVKVQCTGSCQGTCQGACKGKCEGKAGGGGGKGECNGKCEGSCQGSCSGGCEGSADVQASAECEAKAEVSANVEAECTEPELNVDYDAKVVVDKPKVEAVAEALKTGLPKMISVSAKLRGPTALAVKTWAKTAKNLAQASGKLYSSLGDQATCVAGQLAAAAGMVTKVEASVSVSVEASASVSGAAGASGG